MARAGTGLLSIVLSVGVGAVAVAAGADTPFVRVSATPSGGEPDGTSWDAALSADGRFVAFDSSASNITGRATVGFRVFLLDRRTRRVRVVSRHRDGREGLGASPVLSVNGRFVAFCTGDALVPGGSVPPRPRTTTMRSSRRTTCTSTTRCGAAPSSPASRAHRPANFHSCAPSISADGRYVAFESESPRIVAGDTNGDRLTRTTRRASVSSSGAQGDAHTVAPAISGDGRFVAFCSGSTTLVARGPVHGWDLYVRDLRAGRTSRAGPGSCSERPALSRDGRWIAYLTSAPQFEPGVEAWAQPVLVDRVTGHLRLAAPAPLPSHGHHVSISSDGRMVAFAAEAPSVDPARPSGVTDVFVFDAAAGSISRISTYPGASLAFADSEHPALSGDGRSIAFDSTAQLLPDAHDPHRRVVYLRRLR